MPQPFNNAVITNKGLQLLTRAQSGKVNIEFTRIVTGSGIYSEDEKKQEILQEKSELKKQENSYALSSVNVHSDVSVKITALITNQDPLTLEALVSKGYYINEMGVYAKPHGTSESEEILYCLAVTSGETGDFMPAYNGYNPAQIIQDFFVTVSNSSEVTVQGNNGSVALADDVNAFIQQTNETLRKKLDTDGDAQDTYVTFKRAEERMNIASGEKTSVVFGKITKWFSDMKNAAFHSVINNLLATEAGIGVLDAYQGKVLNDKIAELNRKSSSSLNLETVGNTSTKSVLCRRYGHVVILDFYDIVPPSVPAGNKVIIARGLPKPALGVAVTMLVPNTKDSGGLRVCVNNDGNLVYWWVGINIVTFGVGSYTGQLIYFTDD